MAISLSLTAHGSAGNLRWRVYDATFDASYPTGGEALSAATLGFKVLYAVTVAAADGYTFEYDHSAAKVLVYTPRGAHTHTFTLSGRGSTFPVSKLVGVSTHAAAGKVQDRKTANVTIDTNSPVDSRAAAAGTQVANATDLSAVVTRIMAWGI